MADAPEATMRLVLKNIVLPLADFALEINIEIESRVTALFGPSGSGKTSLLDLIAGLRRPRAAFIQLDERVLTDTTRKTFVPTRHRGIGYVPQDLALFPHLSVRQNLLYGHRPDMPAPFRFEHIVDVLEIQPLLQRGVTRLSGGEKQRVALARALLASPRLLLLDEPLASLDAELKARIIPYLLRVRDEFGIPMIYVTHERAEAMAMADDIVVLSHGKVAEAGAVAKILR
jgi:molybdate transport system ATP-binding protein